MGANDEMKISEKGYALLRLNEGVVFGYYNDIGRNCTWGVGTLEHYGPCTAEEMRRSVTYEQVNALLDIRAKEAAQAVRDVVRDYALTQEQFDAAVSFAYNSRPNDVLDTLKPANMGNMASVAREMKRRIFVFPRDRQGRKIGPARPSHGLRLRRQREAAPFEAAP